MLEAYLLRQRLAIVVAWIVLIYVGITRPGPDRSLWQARRPRLFYRDRSGLNGRNPLRPLLSSG
jgi:hypothetical protein